MNELVLSDVCKTFGNYKALDRIGLTVHEGEFFTLLGPSGCGKTTTLSCIAGLERPDSGVIRVDETIFFDGAAAHFLPPEERNLGMVFQSYALWPHMSVAQNVGLPLRLRKVPKAKRDTMIDSVLDQVGLRAQRERYPHQLSGGQQQRVALARALVYSPSLLLLDEPLSNLDAKLRDSARSWLKRLQREIGVTTIYVTHDQAEALSLSDRIAVMGSGHMLQIDTPRRIYEHPVSEPVADFIGHCNFFSARVVTVDAKEGTLFQVGDQMRLRARAEHGHAVGASVRLGIRAEKIAVRPRLGSDGDAVNAVAGRLVETAYVGDHYEYQVEVSDRRVRVESARRVDPGDVTLVVPETDVYVLPDETGAA